MAVVEMPLNELALVMENFMPNSRSKVVQIISEKEKESFATSSLAQGVLRCNVASTTIVSALSAAASELPCDTVGAPTSSKGGTGTSDWTSSSPRGEDLP